jgi:hypothetical protein
VLTLSGNASQPLTGYTITDAIGRTVQQGSLNRATGPFRADVPVQSLQPGAYLISIEAQGAKTVRRFVRAAD